MKYAIIFGAVLLVGVAIYLAFVFTPFNKIKFKGEYKKLFANKIKEDLSRMERSVEGMKDAMKELDKRRVFFDIQEADQIDEAQKEEVLQYWAVYLDHYVELNKLVEDYKYFYQINYFKEKELHAQSFLIAYASYLTIYHSGVQMIDWTINNDLMATILDDEHQKYGIPRGMYRNLKWNVLHFNDVLRIQAGKKNFDFLQKDFEEMGYKKNYVELFEYIDESNNFVSKKLGEKSVDWFIKNGQDILKEKVYNAWFPVQKNVAKKMGETRLTLRHENFITPEQIKKMKKDMEPGDLILERRNWYTSNIGIPGFWPHVAIYLGSWEEFENYFNDPSVEKYFKNKGFNSLEEYLKSVNSDFFNKYKKNDKEVIEALAPGVVLKPLMESANADYVGVLRPNIEKLKKLESTTKAIENFGKPYDFDFNFLTDSALVCSELVYKGFKESIPLELKDFAGRKIFTATDLAEKFDLENDKRDSSLKFVYFLDGNEEKGRALVEGENEFRKTLKRPKWDVMQK